MTRFQLHCHAWKDGCGSEFCNGARKVFYRGDIPADILFVGEAPGKSENTAGIPFHPGAPAGKLLMSIVKRSVIRYHKKQPSKHPQGVCLTECAVCKTYESGLDGPCTPYKIGYTNVVSCIPRDSESTDKLTEPTSEQTLACKPRLEEIIFIANPRLIVAVGKIAEGALTRGYLHATKIPIATQVINIVHPAFILRQTTAFQGLEVQRCCIAIKEAIHLLENPPKKDAPREKAKFRFSGRKTSDSSGSGSEPTQSENPNTTPFADYDDLYSVDGIAPY